MSLLVALVLEHSERMKAYRKFIARHYHRERADLLIDVQRHNRATNSALAHNDLLRVASLRSYVVDDILTSPARIDAIYRVCPLSKEFVDAAHKLLELAFPGVVGVQHIVA